MTRTVALALCLVGRLAVNASAATLYSESVSGDLGNSPPVTLLTLGLGTNTVSGSQFADMRSSIPGVPNMDPDDFARRPRWDGADQYCLRLDAHGRPPGEYRLSIDGHQRVLTWGRIDRLASCVATHEPFFLEPAVRSWHLRLLERRSTSWRRLGAAVLLPLDN
jgi:hypothetical protein